jgi:hypothetical protein
MLRRRSTQWEAAHHEEKLNGAAGVIARTQDFLQFRPGLPAFALLDFDPKVCTRGCARASLI